MPDPGSVPAATSRDLCADAGDALALGRSWAGVLGLSVIDQGDGSGRLDGSEPTRTIWLNRVPEPRTVKTRLHLDVMLPTADPAPLAGLGARVVSEADGEQRWWVLADPEGNEFCAFAPR